MGHRGDHVESGVRIDGTVVAEYGHGLHTRISSTPWGRRDRTGPDRTGSSAIVAETASRTATMSDDLLRSFEISSDGERALLYEITSEWLHDRTLGESAHRALLSLRFLLVTGAPIMDLVEIHQKAGSSASTAELAARRLHASLLAIVDGPDLLRARAAHAILAAPNTVKLGRSRVRP